MGKIVAEQIGAQIFVDGWGMVCPGDPEKAVSLRRAEPPAVSHDGEAKHGAQVIAAMEAAGVRRARPERTVRYRRPEPDPPGQRHLLGLIGDVRGWADGPRGRLAGDAQADPGAVRLRQVRRQLPHGPEPRGRSCWACCTDGDDFGRSLMTIANTAGWDTDCNSGNVGCLLGIKNGLAGIDAGKATGRDWRGPVADRLLSADGGRRARASPMPCGKRIPW